MWILKKLNSALSGLAVISSATMMAVLVIATIWQVYGRYVLNDTPTWTEQLAIGLMLYVVSLMSAVGTRAGTHLRVLVLTDRMAVRQRFWIDQIINVLLLLFFFAMVKYGANLMQRTSNNPWQLLGISRMYFYLPIVLTGAMSFSFTVENILIAFQKGEEK